MKFTLLIAVHMTAALSAVAIGPVALWARLGGTVRPRWHRAAGYAWTTCMVTTLISAIFIRDFTLPNIGGYTPIHLLIVYSAINISKGFLALKHRHWDRHRAYMQQTYLLACVVTGIFTLLPTRYLGRLVWGEWLGVL